MLCFMRQIHTSTLAIFGFHVDRNLNKLLILLSSLVYGLVLSAIDF